MILHSISSKLAIKYIDSNGYECWATKGGEADLSPDENEQNAYQKLDAMILQAHSNSIGNGVVIQQQSSKKETIGTDEDIYAMMDKCKNVEELKTWFIPANANGKSLMYYNKKMQQLSNNNSEQWANGIQYADK